MRLDIGYHSPRSFVDNALLTGLTTSYESELSISGRYEDYMLSNADIYGGLRRRFGAIRESILGGNLTSQTLDEFTAALNALVDIQSSVEAMISSSRLEREFRPKFN